MNRNSNSNSLLESASDIHVTEPGYHALRQEMAVEMEEIKCKTTA